MARLRPLTNQRGLAMKNTTRSLLASYRLTLPYGALRPRSPLLLPLLLPTLTHPLLSRQDEKS